jgi:hypothetical protein
MVAEVFLFQGDGGDTLGDQGVLVMGGQQMS